VSAGQAVAPLQSLIGSRIVVLREQRVMLDSDLAELYAWKPASWYRPSNATSIASPATSCFSWQLKTLRL